MGECTEGSLRLSIDYPAASPVRRVERTVTPDPNAPAVDLEFRIAVREDCRLPIGLHPVLRLPAGPGGAQLEPGRFDHGLTYPAMVEPSAPLFAENVRFADLTRVPTRRGETIDASRLPLAVDTEELLQLNGIDGTAALANEVDGYRVRLTWQKEHFPSLLLWFSNRGRKQAPWSGRHLAIGVEPICSPFGLGPPTALADNPIARSGTPTAVALRRDEPFVTRYRIEVEALIRGGLMHQSLVKPNRPVITDLAGLAAMVHDGDTFGVGGHHFARLPIALLCAIATRGVRDLHYVSWAGGLPLEMLLDADAVASIDICFSSLDIFGLPPRFRAAAEAETVPVRDWTALAMIQALRAAEANLPSLPFQLPAGSDMMDRVPGARTVADPLSEEPVGVVPPLRLDTFVLHAPRADALGNVEICGARALDWPMVGAARTVLVTVEEIVPAGSLQRGGPVHPHPQPGERDRAGRRRRLADLVPAALRHRLRRAEAGLRGRKRAPRSAATARHRRAELRARRGGRRRRPTCCRRARGAQAGRGDGG